jgi:microcystin degradation protein MlrC
VRIAIGGIMHESNSFNPVMTGFDKFTVHRGEEIVPWWAQAHHEMGGFIEGATAFGYELVPLVMATATPGGAVTAEAFEALANELVEQVRNAGKFDGLLLAVHGAMVSEAHRDGDGEILRRLRQVTGPHVPIVVTHDLHANVSEQLVRDCTALVIYKTYPHLDHRERGLQAAQIIARTVRGEVHPVQAIVKPPMLLNIVRQGTSAEPMKSIMQAVRDAENHPKVLAASLAESYQYADVYEMGPSVVVVTDGDLALATSEAQRLADLLWNIREDLDFDLPEAVEAVTSARQSERTPVVLVDLGDNIGGGSAGDSTFILSELLAQEAEGWLVVLADPVAVQACATAGIGATVTLDAGGKTDNLHGSPVRISGRVKCLHDGRYTETEARHGGQRYFDQGLSAVIELPGATPDTASYVILTTYRQPPFSLQQLISLGIQPQHLRIVVVKAAIAYRAAYEPIAGDIIEVDTGGLTAVNPSRFTFRHVRENLWGLGGA